MQVDSYLYHAELERHTMHPVHLVLEVEDVDELASFCVLLLFRNTLREDLRVLVQVQDRVITQRFPIESIGTCLVNTYPSAFVFVCDLGLLDQGLYQVLNRTCLRNQQVIWLL